MKALVLYIAAVGIPFPALAFNSTCYQPPYQGGGPEGHVAAGDTPCSPTSDDDMARACCGHSDGSICLSNGLCFVPQNNSMLQGSCTDPSWTSPGCPNTNCVGMLAGSVYLLIDMFLLRRVQTPICNSVKVHLRTSQPRAIVGGFGFAVLHHNLALMRHLLLVSSKDTLPILGIPPPPRLPRSRLRNSFQQAPAQT